MARDAMISVTLRAQNDEAFREQLRSSPESALAGYDLTAEERVACISWGSGELSDEELGDVAGGYAVWIGMDMKR
jgi:hypothetical protein